MNRLLAAIICTVLFSPYAYATPGHCWYYLHNDLNDISFDECVQKAEKVLHNNGYKAEIRKSNDQQITYARSRTIDISIDILCYKFDSNKEDVMSFITAAGKSACPVAKAIFKDMKSTN